MTRVCEKRGPWLCMSRRYPWALAAQGGVRRNATIGFESRESRCLR